MTVTVTALEGEALRLMDSAVERLERALSAVRSADPGLARDVLEDCRRGQVAAHGLSASVLALFAGGPLPASQLRRAAALVHVVTRIRHIDMEVAAIAGVAAMADESAKLPPDAERALELMERLTLRRLRRAREAYARQSSVLAGELMGTAPELGGVSAPLLSGSAVVLARCLERIEDDAGEIAEQVVSVSGGLFEELADGPRLGDLPASSAVTTG